MEEPPRMGAAQGRRQCYGLETVRARPRFRVVPFRGPGHSHRPLKGNPTGQHVLVVDDDADFSEALAALIRGFGYKVSVASNGREALASLSGQAPALILVDLMMPVMSGSRFLQVVRQDPLLANIPCVILTGVNDLMLSLKEDLEVLYKPLSEAALLRVLRRYCTRPV